MPKTRRRNRISEEARLRKARERRRKQQPALEKELCSTPSILKNYLLQARPEVPSEKCLLLPIQAGNYEPIPQPVTQVATVGLVQTVDGEGSSRVLQESIADGVRTLKQIGLLYPVVLAPALPNQTITTPNTKFVHPNILQNLLQNPQSKKSAKDQNAVVESGVPVEEVEVKVELRDLFCDEEISPEEDGPETISEKETHVNFEEELSLDAESSAKRTNFSEENNCSLTIKEEVNDSSLLIKEEENYSSFIINEEEINSSLVIKKEENPLEFVDSPSMSAERTVNKPENVQTQDISYPLGDSISHDQTNVHAAIVMDTTAEVKDVEFVETGGEGPADAVDQNTGSRYLFVEANINEDLDGSLVNDSSGDSADQDPLCDVANPDWTEENLWSCSICKARFGCEENLEIHLRGHAAYDLVCSICNERFFDKRILNDHLKIHSDVIPKRQPNLTCTDCKERFANAKDLVEHCKIHSKYSNPFKCTDCKERFAEVKDLVAHCKIHKTSYPFQCALCAVPERFATEVGLAEHRKKNHHFDCLNCDKSFTTMKSLKEHFKTAHYANQFKCTHNYCLATFTHHESLVRHISTPHNSQRISCFVCKESFSSKASLNSHLRNVHAKNGGLHSWKSWEAWKSRRAKTNNMAKNHVTS